MYFTSTHTLQEMSQLAAKIADNLANIRQRIADAAIRSGRRINDVKLVAATKYVGLPEIQALIDAGCHDLGESRPQMLWKKADELANTSIRWHLIGHLQRNKIRRTLPLVSLIHSADSLRLIQAIDETAAELNLHIPILLEVNTSGETAKGGFEPEDVEPLLDKFAVFKHIKIQGLMCMAALEGDESVARRNFAALRELRQRLSNNCPPEIVLPELSMGMSGDYITAIEEGATIVRIGSALFEGVNE